MGISAGCCRIAAARVGIRRASPSSHFHIGRRYTTELLESVTRQSFRRANDDKKQIDSSTCSFLRCFPLRADDVVESPDGPGAFHRRLCQKVGRASRRVQLASLYVGAAPGSSLDSSMTMTRRTTSSQLPHQEERELLESIAKAAAAGVPVQILLDANRALRPIPVPSATCPSSGTASLVNGATTTGTTTSAQACYEAVGRQSSVPASRGEGGDGGSSGVFLLSVLHPVLQRILPNPVNEIAGVFHIKVYVVDDDVILSGANLSHEYFTTRIDRYLHLKQPDLVNFYSQLVTVLCQHGAVRYEPGSDDGRPRTDDYLVSRARRRQLQAALKDLFTTKEPPSIQSHPDDVVAYAVPTFQAPARYFSRSKHFQFISHEQALRNLLESVHEATGAARGDDGVRGTVTARIATAYMNPTRPWLRALATWCDRTVFLTAGWASHGFAPKAIQKATDRPEDQSQGWTIPHVFRYASRRAVRYIHFHRRRRRRLRRTRHPHHQLVGEPSSSAVQMAYYQRPGWTFHAKGMWLSMEDPPSDTQPLTSAIEFSPHERLVAVCTGSGNYGARSALRDMESNLILIFPPSSPAVSHASAATDRLMETANPLVRQHVDEWDCLCEFASEEEMQGIPEPPRWIWFAYPWVRRFF